MVYSVVVAGPGVGDGDAQGREAVGDAGGGVVGSTSGGRHRVIATKGGARLGTRASQVGAEGAGPGLQTRRRAVAGEVASSDGSQTGAVVRAAMDAGAGADAGSRRGRALRWSAAPRLLLFFRRGRGVAGGGGLEGAQGVNRSAAARRRGWISGGGSGGRLGTGAVVRAAVDAGEEARAAGVNSRRRTRKEEDEQCFLSSLFCSAARPLC